MAEQQVFKYVPRFLAKRYPAFAELEDNPIYLRESGKKYGDRRRLWSILAPSGNPIIDFLRTSAFLLVSGLLLLFGFSCCVMLPVMLVVVHNFADSNLSLGGSLLTRLKGEWQAGQLEHLALSSLTGRELVWGYVCGRLEKTCWRSAVFITTVAIFCLLLSPYVEWNLTLGFSSVRFSP